ncbi:hypothetical protein K466DRAFT_570869 [Polyporus arcularius HHB13444]|uniref:Uncharacterized protein n=1 Tax=Polyporus arcularius HHB13444 TaxID=1314778 RepID=A0A5C3NY35_9APHY|nr:hypothetical protein K466DRAFT_570869 [Polyporus arcularius HHB13444]
MEVPARTVLTTASNLPTTRALDLPTLPRNSPDLPFNQEVKTLKSGLNITAEFIIMEYTESERRITDVKRLDKQKMDDMVVSVAQQITYILEMEELGRRARK